MHEIYEWLNVEKSRYYKITVKNYESSNIIFDFCWGGCNSNRGGKMVVNTKEEAQEFITKMMKRRKSRGYKFITPLSN